MNHEYPIHIKRARDKLRPILKLVKSIPHYKEKSKLVDDKLVVNGINYGLNNLAKLPANLVAYKAVEKSDDNTIVFQGEHWIQFQKALPFGDATTTDMILNTL